MIIHNVGDNDNVERNQKLTSDFWRAKLGDTKDAGEYKHIKFALAGGYDKIAVCKECKKESRYTRKVQFCSDECRRVSRNKRQRVYKRSRRKKRNEE